MMATDLPVFESSLRHQSPLAATAILAFLRPRAVPGVEAVTAGGYARSVRVGRLHAVTTIRAGEAAIEVKASTEAALASAVAGARRLFGVDADPRVVDGALSADDLLMPLVERTPGLRIPGTFSGFELAIRAVLGQQISVTAATTLSGRLVEAYGEPLGESMGAVTHLFPTADVIAEADLSILGMPGSRRTTLTEVARAVAGGSLVLDGSADLAVTVERLLALPGIGPWTASYIAMRALGDGDAFPETDLGLRRAYAVLSGDRDPAALARRAERWRPWRGYAAMHLWASLRTG